MSPGPVPASFLYLLLKENPLLSSKHEALGTIPWNLADGRACFCHCPNTFILREAKGPQARVWGGNHLFFKEELNFFIPTIWTSLVQLYIFFRTPQRGKIPFG